MTAAAPACAASPRSTAQGRRASYAVTLVLLFAGFWLLRGFLWQGNSELHTLMEVVATLLALNVGVLALVRFYSQKDNTFLFIGSGFLGTGLLDGYHAVVTSSHFVIFFPSPSTSLVPWSWLASRLFLSVTLCLSWLFWKREQRLGRAGTVDPKLVYAMFAALTLVSFLFFAFVPLPAGYRPGLIFPRPQEFVPAALFAIALVGYLRKGEWKHDAFEHWLVLALIVSFMSQAMFMSTSRRIYDEMFDLAHLLKQASYICVLIGLLINMYRLFILSAKEAVIVQDINTGVFVDVNQRICDILGYSRSEMLKLNLPALSLGTPPYSQSDLALFLRNAASGSKQIFDWPCRAKDGRIVWLELSMTHDANGEQATLLSTARDITEHRRIGDALRASERKYRNLFEHTLDAIMTVDPSTGRFLSANRGAVKLFGTKDEEEFILGTPWDYSPEWQPDGRASVEKSHEMIETAIREGSQLFEWTHKRIDGVEFPADVLLTPVVYGEETLIYVTVRDVTERKRAEEQISRMARYDKLTGLVNRQVFVEALEVAVARARRDGRCFALLYLDLDHFKDVNDTLGHPVGDLLLVAVAARLRASVRELDTVARFGGDEFAVLVSDIEEPADAATVSSRLLATIAEPIAIQEAAAAAAAAAAAGVTDKILHAISEPYSIQGNEIRSGATVGIAVYGPDIPDIETILSHADVALYRAKSEARGTYRFFSDAMDTEVRARVALGTELREAIASDQLFLMYQPQVELDTGRIVGLEALVRWHHPTRGTVGPGYFIPEAERNGLIVPLGHWVMREACHQAKKWLDAGIAPPLVAVNLSGVQFKRPLDLEKDIAAILAESGLPARSLELELTESTLMEASREHNDLLLRFRKAGYRVAIDDFGSGYSSLGYLRRFPVDRIKIAQSFIANIGQEPGNDAIVRAALGLARELAIEVVVEGVETAAQLELLKGWGGRVVQGFYFSRPLPAPEVTGLLRIGKIIPTPVGMVKIAAPV